MAENSPQILLSGLFEKYTGTRPMNILKLPPSGSYREYYRIYTENKTAIGVYNNDTAENKAFLSFTKHFYSKNIPVPEVLAEDNEQNIYLLQDLGDTTLLNYMQDLNYPNEVKPEIITIYKKAIELLPKFQVTGNEGFNYSLCYPRSAFDRQSMLWDLNYFKYYFLKLAKVPFNEQLLENDFGVFIDFLLSADCNYFLYRDFQSRNVMILNNQPHFIDYQGGRKGALHYDIASILFEAKTNLSPNLRDELLDHYIESLNKYIPVSKQKFIEHYYGYVYIRLMQAMGAYGFRGLYEKKELFLQSIPLALNHLEWLLENATIPVSVPELTKVWQYLTDSEYIRHLAKKQTSLTISINSFSYRRNIPYDDSANGGGFVFDCRAIHNPGRYDEYKHLTGKDQKVKEFFRNETDMTEFLEHSFSLVDRSVRKYLDRGFTNLMVNFGCTGGQHRSVYAAETLNQYLLNNFKNKDIIIHIRHRELEMKTEQA